MKYLTNSGLSYFLNKIKTYIASQLNSKANLTHTHSASDITSGLATVATSGSYNDLSNKPTIPSKTSDLANDSGFLTSHQDLSGYVPRSGGAVMTGDNLARTINNSLLKICGGTAQSNGGTIALYGKDTGVLPGTVVLQPALSSSSYCNFILYPDGTATWGGKNLAMQEDTIPLTGTSALAGSIVPGTDNAYNLGSSTKQFYIVHTSNIFNHGTTNELALGNTNDGADMALCPKEYNAGFFRIRAFDGTTRQSLNGYADGRLTWGSKNVAMYEDVIPRSGGAVMTGTELGRTDTTDRFAICSGTDTNSGGNILLYANAFGDADNSYRGAIGLYALTSYYVYKAMFLYPDGTWIWTGTAVQLQSDRRVKQQISKIDNALLDAWEDVDLVQFKYNDAVNEKGDNARLHTGYVVQQIEEACKSHNVEISDYGLYCHEEYPEETEEVEVEQEDGTKTKERKVIREASEHYSLRYTETLVVECAYLRKRIKELEERLEKLEGNSK